MHFSGIADEAGRDLATQIRAHHALGWSYIELRTVSGTQWTDLPDDAFEAACRQLEEAGLRVSGFASGIANWSTRISDPFEHSTETLARTIPRMQRLQTRYLRVMSYPNDGWSETDWGDEAVRRMKRLGEMAEAGGIVLLVENCDGWASLSPEHYARFFERVDSPAVRAVYDTGNPASHGHSDTWEWFIHARPHIEYIHIKAHTDPQPGDSGRHVWPDEGASCVEATLRELFGAGYDGFISIEPHIASVIHEGRSIDRADVAYESYVEYGRRLMQLVERVQANRVP